jgi:hypothetical protein
METNQEEYLKRKNKLFYATKSMAYMINSDSLIGELVKSINSDDDWRIRKKVTLLEMKTMDLFEGIALKTQVVMREYKHLRKQSSEELPSVDNLFDDNDRFESPEELKCRFHLKLDDESIITMLKKKEKVSYFLISEESQIQEILELIGSILFSLFNLHLCERMKSMKRKIEHVICFLYGMIDTLLRLEEYNIDTNELIQSYLQQILNKCLK